MSDTHFGVSQSEYMAGRDNGVPKDAFNVVSAEYKPKPLFPDSSDTLILWGLEGVLVRTPEYAEAAFKAAFKKATCAALEGGSQKLTEDGVALVHRLVDESYDEHKLPVRKVAEFFGKDERSLLIDVLSRVAKDEMAYNPTQFGMGDQGVLNYFGVACDAKISHAVVTSTTHGFASLRLHFAALDQYIPSIFGADVYTGSGDRLLRKSDPSDAKVILERVLKDVPSEKRGRVIVADHNAAFLQAARELGLKTALIDFDGQLGNQSHLADSYHRTAECFFKNRLGIKDPGSRRDTHVFAGIRGGSSFRPSEA